MNQPAKCAPDLNTEQGSKTVKTTCPYCGVGCGVLATLEADGSVSINGDPDHPSNFGRLCSKGSALGETLDLDDRLLQPEISGTPATWEDALDLVAEKFSASIQEHGPDSVAFYLSGQLLTEDYYVANKLMKGFIGSANIDTNSRLCMSSSVAGHKRAFGADTVPGVYEDIELADLIVLVGSNLAWCHPVLYQRIAAAKDARPDMKVVLIDPRKTMTADIADLHLTIRPDGDIAVFAGLLTHLYRAGVVDNSYVDFHTTGFGDAVELAAQLRERDILEQTGITAEELFQFYELVTRTDKTMTIFSQGVNQSSVGTDKVNAIINCHLATGRIGKPGAGPFSVTGQPNAMGGREVGGLSHLLAAHMEIDRPDHRETVQSFWESPTIAKSAGLKAVELFEACQDGRIKALWIMSTNPVVSMPEADKVKQAIENCPFVVVSDVLSNTDTIQLADVKLPAIGWGEKDGTTTNSERRISRQRSLLAPPGDAKADWWQIVEVAKRMGFENGFDYQNASEIFAEHAALSACDNNGARDFDIGAYAGLSVAAYEALPPFQWPQPKGQQAKQTRFFAKGGFYTPDRKARFVAVSSRTTTYTSQEFPFTLNTGRIRDQWHTMTRTGKSARLSAHIAESFCEIHPIDARRLGVKHGELVKVKSPSGEILVRASVSERQQLGSLFVPMHWTDQYAANSRVDRLVSSRADPLSGQPAFKNTAVALEPFKAKQFGFLVSREKPQALNAAYWALAKCARGWRVELAGDLDGDDLSKAMDNFRAPDLTYNDNESAQTRLAWFDGDQLAAALFIAPRPVVVARDWAVSLLGQSHGSMLARVNVVAGRPGADMPNPGATVCACFSVGINQIIKAVRGGCANVDAVGDCLKAGTNCGSCRAEISGIINEHLSVAAE